MTYNTYRCPHCQSILHSTSGYQRRIDCPICKCPFCGKFYRDNTKKEWATMHPLARFLYWTEMPFCGAFISFVLFAGFSALTQLEIEIAAIIGAACAVVVFVIWFFAQYGRIQNEIEDSLERTKYAEYVALLKEVGCAIYKIKGAEVGTVSANSKVLLQDINPEHDD